MGNDLDSSYITKQSYEIIREQQCLEVVGHVFYVAYYNIMFKDAISM